jgi:hypothetical protein
MEDNTFNDDEDDFEDDFEEDFDEEVDDLDDEDWVYKEDEEDLWDDDLDDEEEVFPPIEAYLPRAFFGLLVVVVAVSYMTYVCTTAAWLADAVEHKAGYLDPVTAEFVWNSQE